MSATTIAHVRGRRLWDSRGQPTIEAEITLAGGASGSAIAPAGASTGSAEALDLRDGGEAFGGRDVTRAVRHVSDEIAKALTGLDANDQDAIDGALIALDGTPDKSRLGGNATIAVSMAVAHAAASAAGAPLWRHLAGGGDIIVPLPEIQIFGGGAHASRALDVQDFMVMCPGAETFAQALDWTARIYHAAGGILESKGLLRGVADEGGFWPVFDSNETGLELLVQAIETADLDPVEDAAISLDIAASEFGHGGKYRLARDKRDLDAHGLKALLSDWCARYPIISVEDPFGEDDKAGFAAFTRAHGDNLQIVGDDLLVTNADRVRDAANNGLCNTALIKPNQAGTLTETRAALDAARATGMGAIVSARSGESEDTTIAHLAVGWGAKQLKVGSFSRSERMSKWNEILRIEEAGGVNARFARDALGAWQAPRSRS